MGMTFTRRGQSKKVERHGKVFQSTTEADFYSALLKVLGGKFYWQYEFCLQLPVPKNKKILLLSGAGVHKIKCTADFVFESPSEHVCIVDTKGSKEFTTERSTMAYHLLKGVILETKGPYFDPARTKILMIDRKEVLTLLKLSSNPSLFWDYFNKLIPF